MGNLLEETIYSIEKCGHKIEDVIFIGSLESGHACRDWNHFKELADFEYDSGYGAQHIAEDLIIAFSNGSHMWRYEYDGSECWQYTKPVQIPKTSKEVKVLGGEQFSWCSLEEMNEPRS